MLAVSMPKAATCSALVDTATKWWGTASSPSASTTHARAVRALVSVSRVVKVFEEMMKSVRAGSMPVVASRMASPLTFETKANEISGSAKSASARWAMAGPRSEPPIPMLTTWRMRSPVAPVHAPERTRVARSAIRSSTSWTSGTTSWPSTSITASRGARRATCRTGRFSVTLMRSPRNIAAARRSTPARSASATSSASVSRVTRFLE